ITAMACGTLRKVLLGWNTVESCALLVQPRRPKRMRASGGVAIMARRREKAKLAVDDVTIVADLALADQPIMRRCPVSPSRT
ncbi:MAG: hypothetical protein WCP86_09270, partial [bacterium]